MKYVYNAYKVHSKKKSQDYFYISIDLVDVNGVILFKGSPILWIDENTYNLLTISK